MFAQVGISLRCADYLYIQSTPLNRSSASFWNVDALLLTATSTGVLIVVFPDAIFSRTCTEIYSFSTSASKCFDTSTQISSCSILGDGPSCKDRSSGSSLVVFLHKAHFSAFAMDDTHAVTYKWYASDMSNVRGSQLQYSDWNRVQTVSQGSFIDVRASDDSPSGLAACQGSMSSTTRSPLASSSKPEKQKA